MSTMLRALLTAGLILCGCAAATAYAGSAATQSSQRKASPPPSLPYNPQQVTGVRG
jgi:hypothetical protein